MSPQGTRKKERKRSGDKEKKRQRERRKETDRTDASEKCEKEYETRKGPQRNKSHKGGGAKTQKPHRAKERGRQRAGHNVEEARDSARRGSGRRPTDRRIATDPTANPSSTSAQSTRNNRSHAGDPRAFPRALVAKLHLEAE